MHKDQIVQWSNHPGRQVQNDQKIEKNWFLVLLCSQMRSIWMGKREEVQFKLDEIQLIERCRRISCIIGIHRCTLQVTLEKSKSRGGNEVSSCFLKGWSNCRWIKFQNTKMVSCLHAPWSISSSVVKRKISTIKKRIKHIEIISHKGKSYGLDFGLVVVSL